MRATTNMVQINARLEQPLKQAGNDALASIGFSPSAAIRALWEKAALRGKDLEEVQMLLSGEPHRSPDAAEKLASLEKARMHVFDILEELGVKDPYTPPTGFESDKEALAAALMQRMEERGLA